MKLAQIKKIISQTPREKMGLIKTKCRPPEKSNEILFIEVGGQKWYCERPQYHWSVLDQSFVSKGFAAEAKKLFPNEKANVFVDANGLWWVSHKLSSLFLVSYYLENPLEYQVVMSKHMVDIQKTINILGEIHKDLNKNNKIILNIKRLAKAYELFYLYASSVFLTFDELLYQFKLFLVEYFDKKTSNIYLTKFLQAEITKEIIAKKYGQQLVIERPNSRGILYASGTKPVVYYRRPKFFHEFLDDMDILEQLVKKNVTSEVIKKFLAFRQIVPIAVQINEEAQYVESQMLSSHASYLMNKVSKLMGKPVEYLEKLTYQKIINNLKKYGV